MKDRILLFIPMYNCEKQIVRVLGQLDSEIQEYISEVIVVNNRSTDDGEAAVTRFVEERDMKIPVNLLRNKENYGLGGSHKVAFAYAVTHGFDYFVVLHGDDQGHIKNLLPYLKNGAYRKYDCFLGARFKKGAQLEGYSRFRTFGNIVYNTLFTIGTGRMINDLGSGLNMYNVEIFKDKHYLKYADNLAFNVCLLLGSCYYKHKMMFFPIKWSEDDQVSNVKMVSQAIDILGMLGAYVVNKKKFA
ncbi:MAG: glycosyltransferase family 2 protein, partial [Eubacteriales bacterium]